MKKAGARGAERESHHAAARRGWRRRRRDAQRCSCKGLQLAVRHGARRQRLLRRRTPTRVRALPVRDGRDAHRRRAGTKVADLPARHDQSSLDQEHHREPRRHRSSTSTVGSNSNVAENGIENEERPRRDSGDRSRDGRDRACSRRACAIRTAWRGSRRRGALWTVGQRARRARQRSRARLHDVGAATAAFYGWPYSYYGQHVDERVQAAAARSRREGASCPTTRSARTPRRSASRSTTATLLSAALPRRRVRRPARLVESQAAQRLQGDLRAVRRTAGRAARPRTC